ncbi:MAG TPA: SUMF1/EgtB/PvdO family nonheme iron enzyme [Myxococcales bacterium]|nr:SUMF1/EgtB/PvdO family nonheme iron enzyme [Myxococcales bacterium]
MTVPQGARGEGPTAQLAQARAFLLKTLARLPDDRWGEIPSPAYSPVGWHLGHVAAMQARWLLPGDRAGERFGGFFDPTQTAKPARTELPSPDELRGWLAEVLERVFERLRTRLAPVVDGLPADFLVRHVSQHELQHAEHVQVIAALFQGRLQRGALLAEVREPARLEFPGGAAASMGSDDAAEVYDNERPAHRVRVEPFWIDAVPVTVQEFGEFVEAGGYGESRLWTPEGWRWRTGNKVDGPLGWPDAPPQHPMSCLSWFEADAFARWRGARLPSEAEWEVARRSGLPGCGQVWEWTSSWFEPYTGFRPYPYDGYSAPWFGTHKVLRGGSWATHPRLKRPTFRNWYEPGFREIPAGLRCAGGV